MGLSARTSATVRPRKRISGPSAATAIERLGAAADAIGINVNGIPHQTTVSVDKRRAIELRTSGVQ